MEGEEASTNLIVEVKNNNEEGIRELINDDNKRMIDDDDVLNNVDEVQQQKRFKPSIEVEPLDIEAYALQYSGRTKILRLIFIADRCDNVAMQLEALRMAYDELKKGKNTKLFKYVVDKINGRLGPDYGSDDAWVDAIVRRTLTRKTQLEEELDSSMSSMIRQGIRLGHHNLGDFYYGHGDVDNASFHYERLLEYCASLKDTIDTCMLIILCKTGKQVNRYVNKAMKKQEALDTITQSKLACVSGLSYLESQQYKRAAIRFMDVDSALGNHYPEVISPQDVATYAGLCALATFNRTELKNKVLDNLNFKNFLEFVPEMRELINDFYNSRYDSCLDYLENLSGKLKLDIHLHNHVKTLYREIRQKALLQYTLPYVTIDLNIMAGAFRTNVAGLEKELAALIVSNKLQARIDSQKKILIARREDQRKLTFKKVLEDGAEMEQGLRAAMLRANLLKIQLEDLNI